MPAWAERPVRSLLEIRREALVVQRWDNSCGAAALATVLRYYKGVPTDEEAVARGMLRQTDALRVRVRGGFSLLDMQRYLARIGLQGDGYTRMRLADLAQRTPMIVPITLNGYPHFIVIRRVTTTGVNIGDPSFGNYEMAASAFAATWKGIGFEITQGSGEPRHERTDNRRSVVRGRDDLQRPDQPGVAAQDRGAGGDDRTPAATHRAAGA
ncbi:C39 family peptidase [Massilia sp. BSC265]|uniref:C39 family peptidase n=1 Tax=Massilia sp. BSC265 TaxID=1549812 RepID=UPI001378CEE4|nr:cysteine peptidase family C39 domain-containing protein [Massilia sp. BSC265]